MSGEAFALIVDAVGEVMPASTIRLLSPLPVHLDRIWAALAAGIHRLDDQPSRHARRRCRPRTSTFALAA